MKHCPQCQTSYTDDTLKYCLQDGAPLVDTADSFSSKGAATIAFNDIGNDEATVISPRKVEPMRVSVQQTQQLPPQNSPSQQNYRQSQSYRQTEPPPIIAMSSPPPQEAKKSKTGLAVALTVLGMLALFGVGGAIYLMRARKTEVAVTVNSNANAPASNRASSAANANSAGNAANNQNLNANAATPATPAPKPSIDPKQAKIISEDVEAVVDNWKSASENLDIDAHLSNYANTVDYYKGGKVGLARVRADKERAFNEYNSINFNISNMKITPDASGDNAIAVFDKEWNFEGEAKNSSGKVMQQLTLSKIGSRWLITGEKDLKTYYVNN